MHPCPGTDEVAFLRGVDAARQCGDAGMLATIFSARTLGLTGELQAEQQADYLSGLLITHELLGLSNHLASEHSTLADWMLGLIGERALYRRYQLALERLGCTDVRVLQGTTEHGLFHIAQDAGLLSPAHAD